MTVKFRVRRHQRVLSDGGIATHYSVQCKGWLFWLDVVAWCEPLGEWRPRRFPSEITAVTYVTQECERLDAVADAKRYLRPVVTIHEQEGG